MADVHLGRGGCAGRAGRVWTATNRHDVRAALPLGHVAGATLVGLFGWEMLVHLPGSVMGYWTLTAGLGDVRGVQGHQAFVVAQAVFVVAAGFAVMGILRRRTWGAILGIGLAVAVVLWRVLSLITTIQLIGEVDGGMHFDLVAGVIGLGAIPAAAAAVLLALPLWQRTPPVSASSGDWSREPAGADRPTN